MHAVRYAHCEGYTEICCALDKSHQFITSGEDGEVRIWQGFDDVDNRSFQVGDKCTALAYGEGKIYVADDQNDVKRYDFENNELLGIVTSFTLAVTCMCLNKANTQLVCGSADFDVHLVDLATLKCTRFSGHEAPILSLCFDPFQKYFISASCDATARVWSVANLNTVKQLNGLHAKSNDFVDSESWCRLAWHKDGGLLAVPSKKNIDFYERESWILKFQINLKNENNPSEEFVASILCFSPDGRYILASTSTQMIFVHSIINKSLVYKYSYSKKYRICSLVWNPSNPNEVLFCDLNGQMGQIKPSLKDIMADSTPSTTNETSTSKTTKMTKTSKPKESKTKESKPKTTKDEDSDLDMDELMELLGGDGNESDEHDHDDDDEDEENVKKKKKKNKSDEKTLKSPEKKRKRLSDDHDEQDLEDANSRDSVAKSKSSDGDDENDECESIEKLKERAYKLAKIQAASLDEASLEASEQNLPEKPKPRIVEIAVKQKPFQPSSTPLNLAERYMVWNSVGVITQHNKEEDDSIDIEFHNSTHHPTIHLKNQFGYTMADVSRGAVVLASPGRAKHDEDIIDNDNDGDDDDEDENKMNEVLANSVTRQSKLTCIMLNALDTGSSSKEWQVDMPRKEHIRCVCASRSLVACATNKNFLRVFSLAGVQREIICLNGSPISLAAYDQKIFACYSNKQNIGYSIFDLSRLTCENGVLPISAESQLVWIGFSEEGNVYCNDSNGYLFCKHKLSGGVSNFWTPIAHLRLNLTHKTDTYWIVGISERNQFVKAILCRRSKHPNVTSPRPNMTTVDMQIPVCDVESEKSKLEQDYWRNVYLSSNLKSYNCQTRNIETLDEDELNEKVDQFESGAREALMKLFMLACKMGKEQRAYDVATIMDADTIQLAIKFATKSRALTLAHNLNELAVRKLEERDKETQLAQVQNYFTISSVEKDDHDVGGTNTPKTVLSEIKKTTQTQSAKENDSWRPTPARKLVKSKVASGNTTPTLGSSFNNR